MRPCIICYRDKCDGFYYEIWEGGYYHYRFVDRNSPLGKDSYTWKFKCPSCGYIQSINSMMEHNPSLKAEEIQNSVYFNCEGRLNEKYGCDWTLGGLFKIHKVEVEFNGKLVPVFEYAIN